MMRCPKSSQPSRGRDGSLRRDAYCEIVRDVVSRDLFSEILESEEERVDFVEAQLELIPKIGIENYIQLRSGAAE